MHPEFTFYNPMRSVSWRYERVRSLQRDNDQPLLPSSWDDEHVRRYWSFLEQYRAAEARGGAEVAQSGRPLEDSTAMMELCGRQSDHWYAHQLHHGDDTELRAIVQAAILARESDQQIAARIGTIPEAFGRYEKLFFNVRDRLDCSDWIAKEAIGIWLSIPSAPDGGETEAQRHYVYKAVGYHGRTLALDAVLGFLHDEPAPAQAEDSDDWFDSTLRAKTKARALAALMTLAINKFNAVPLAGLGVRALDSQGKQDAEQPKTSLEAAVADMISEIPSDQLRRQ